MADGIMQLEKAGGLVITVDRGRRNAGSQGLAESGPMDEHALLWANHLLGNPDDAAALEITLGNVSLTFSQPAGIALCGADMQARINGQPAGNWCSRQLQAGDRLQLGMARNGLRSYLAIADGFIVPRMAGSACCVVREQLGGPFAGRSLKAGDSLAYRPRQVAQGWVPRRYQRQYNDAIVTLRLLPCYQYRQFSRAARQQFFSQVYTISAEADRMGYRLAGQPIVLPGGERLSEGIALGSVQISNDGQPIVLMRDRQSIGGYPKIGTVFSTDVEKLAQLAPGRQVQFVEADLAKAWQERQQREWFFAGG